MEQGLKVCQTHCFNMCCVKHTEYTPKGGGGGGGDRVPSPADDIANEMAVYVPDEAGILQGRQNISETY